MERASRLLRQLKLTGDVSEGEVACAAWPGAVGKVVAARTRAARMVRTRLVVEVEDKTWQRQLFGLTGQILRNLEKTLGPGWVEDIEFRVVPRRRGPQRAEAAVPSGAADEADAISDPMLRRIYKASRIKARA
jgi:hypothetical protein